MFSSAVVKAPAKLNLALDITGKRDDGYHLMNMIMQAVDLCDIIELAKTDKNGITVMSDKDTLPCDKTNIAYKAAEAFFKTAGIKNYGVCIGITKNIPMQAGLGGGSADGAAVLVGLDYMYSTGFTQDELCEIGVKIGADIPFCITGGTASAEGVGEILNPLPLLPECYIVVAKPRAGVKTSDAFARFDALGAKCRPNIKKMSGAVIEGNLQKICDNMYNVLQEVTELPQIDKLCVKMKGMGALGSAMSGSGSAVFGIFDNKKAAKRCLTALMGEVDSVFLVNPAEYGAHIICDRKYSADDYISIEE